MKHSTLIIGGGIVGASLALKLAQAQCPVTLIDARPTLSDDQWQQKLNQKDARVYALNLASIQLLKQVGAWQHIAQSNRKADYTHMQVWQKNGIGELNFGDDPNNPLPKLLGSMVEPLVIEHALFQQLTNPQLSPYLTLINGHKTTSIDWLGEKSGYQITLDNQKTLQAQLLIGADGRNSIVRRQAGIELDYLDYQQIAICCAICTQKPHLATARQIMLPTGTLALLPLADITPQEKANPQHWQSVVWTLPTNLALDLLTLEPTELAQKIASACNYELGNIEQIQSIAHFPLNAQQAKTYVKPNLALIGDSAHGVHPLAGQGLNLGMLDVQALFAILLKDFKRSGGKNWANIQTLKSYERQRRLNNSIMMHSFSAINWLFSSNINNIAPIQHLRSHAIHNISKNRALLNFFAKQASGL